MTTTLRTALTTLLVTTCLVACSIRRQSPTAPPSSAAAADPRAGGVGASANAPGALGEGASAAGAPAGPMIVELRGRREVITITSGPTGPLYSARTRDGEALVSNATLDELRAAHPELYEQLHPLVANETEEAVGPIADTPIPASADVFKGPMADH